MTIACRHLLVLVHVRCVYKAFSRVYLVHAFYLGCQVLLPFPPVHHERVRCSNSQRSLPYDHTLHEKAKCGQVKDTFFLQGEKVELTRTYWFHFMAAVV